MNIPKINVEFLIEDVRVLFPHFFEREEFNGEVGKYSGKFILPKESQPFQVAGEAVKSMMEGRPPLTPDRLCLRLYPQYGEDVFVLSASSNDKPKVVDRALQEVGEDDGLIYSGAYVNATFSLWYQDNEYGRRINCNLDAVQFFRHGERLGGKRVVVIADTFKKYDQLPGQAPAPAVEGTVSGEFVAKTTEKEEDLPF